MPIFIAAPIFKDVSLPPNSENYRVGWGSFVQLCMSYEYFDK